MNDKTPLNFIKEQGLLQAYYDWGGKKPQSKDRREYHRMWYLRRKEMLFKSIK